MKVKKTDLVGSYFSRVRPFSFHSTLDCVTSGIALLELWLEDFKESKNSNCPFAKKTFLEVSSLVESMRGSL